MSIIIKVKSKSEDFEIKLAPKPISIGRSSKANLTVDDETLSRIHCLVYLHNGIATVKDNDSKNGTIRNGSIIHEHHLYLGDKIEVGDTVIHLLMDQMTADEKKRHRRS